MAIDGSTRGPERPTWRSASRSRGDQCIRVSHRMAYIILDDSKRPSPATGEALVFAPGEWQAFLSRVRTLPDVH